MKVRIGFSPGSSFSHWRWLAACLTLGAVASADDTRVSPIVGAVSRQSLAGALPMPASGERVAVSVAEKKFISHQSQYYHGWGTVAAGRDGTLHLVYSGGRDYHVCPLGRLEYMTSHDEGATWTWPRVLDDSLTDNRDSGVVETPNGVLLAGFYTSIIGYQIHMNDPERLIASVFGDHLDETLEKWRMVEARSTQAERKADVGFWMKRSTDGGLTWSPRYQVPGYNPHGPVALRDGRMFFAAAHDAYVSADDGITWTLLSKLPTGPGEMHSIEAADGSLIVHVRNKIKGDKGTTQRIIQSRSEDGGKTWDAPRVVAEGYPSHLVRLADGTLITTYGWRQAPFGIRGKLSRDHGRSWSEEFIVTDDGASWDLGYPSTVQLKDGGLLTVWYEAPAGSHLAGLRQAKWNFQVSSGHE